MANREELRNGLRRLLQEHVADQWDDDMLNEVLNDSLRSIQEFILMVDPEAFAIWQAKSIVANQRFYLRPVDILWDFEVGYSDAPATSDYSPLVRKPYQELRSGDAGRPYTEANAVGTYAKIGAYYYLGWNPEVAVANGLMVGYVPWLSMDEDDDVPAISLGFHRVIKVDAAIKILEETPEDTSKMEKERAEFFEKIKVYYHSSATTPEAFAPDLSGLKNY